MSKLFLLLFLFLVVTVISITAQVNEINDLFVCKEVENTIEKSFEITKIGRRVSYEDECELYVYSYKKWFSVSIEKLATLKLSKEDFSFDFDVLTLTEVYPKSLQYLNRNKFWSEARSFHDSPDSADHLVMLRYKKINITIIGSDYQMLLKVKRLFQSVNFEKHSN